jgi:hypothetical protein
LKHIENKKDSDKSRSKPEIERVKEEEKIEEIVTPAAKKIITQTKPKKTSL